MTRRILVGTLGSGIALFASLVVNGPSRADDPAAKKVDRPAIYDTKAEPRAQIAKAAGKAKKDGKRVLVMFGGNWCGWCHKLHDVFAKDRDVHKTIYNEYELVLIDSGHEQIPAIYKEFNASPKGVPFLAVLDANGKLLTTQDTEALEEGDHHNPKKVQEFLTKWVVEPPNAEKLVAEALAQASSQDKLVFLHFGAPWCGWCHKLDDFLARPDMKETLGSGFIDLKIDLERMTKGPDVEKRFREKQGGGIPWFAFLDADGKIVATSDGPKGNVGYPAEPFEISHFLDMLKSSKKLSADQISKVEVALKKAAEELKAPRTR